MKLLSGQLSYAQACKQAGAIVFMSLLGSESTFHSQESKVTQPLPYPLLWLQCTDSSTAVRRQVPSMRMGFTQGPLSNVKFSSVIIAS